MSKPLPAELWENIRTFALDDPASGFPFSKKLQKENNWTSTFTAEAIEEYRKFIFLCCILPEGASPSDTVDKVWHLHLTYTTNYWIEFCQKTLHKDIHHFPSKGGGEEQTRHHNWYQQTLEQYHEVFGTAPPAAIWPVSPYKEKQIPVEIYDEDFFKKTVLIFVVLTILFVAGLNLFGSTGEDFLLYYFILMVAGIAVSGILQQHKSKKLEQVIDQQFPKKFTACQVAMFLYGTHRAYQTALIDLLKRDIIETLGDDYKLTTAPVYDPQKEENPLFPLLTETIAAGKTFTYQEGLGFIKNDKLQHPSFEQLTSLSKRVDYQKFIIPGIVLAIGFARLLQGMANEKPVGYLVAEIGFFSLIALMIAAQYSYTYLVFKKSENIWMNQNNKGYSNNILNNFTLLGVTAVAGFAEYQVLTSVFESAAPTKRRKDDGGLAGSYSSCSSGGDSGGSSGGDSGCGGCGGGD
ncbi:MAG: hypothetical protein H7Z13_05190 [Ferruginibacter sp.]|nr:hypothetical protein [Ferruginibacter sp.]